MFILFSDKYAGQGSYDYTTTYTIGHEKSAYHIIGCHGGEPVVSSVVKKKPV